MTNLSTKEPITWCPGCTNFLAKKSYEDALKELIDENWKKEEFVLVADIGCSSKMFDYLDVSGFNTLHGRVLPTAFGIKIGNPNLKVIGVAGDGGTYNEGLDHLIHNCRYNSDMTFIVHNNQLFALTVGQATAVTELGYKEKTHPFGVKEIPINPLVLALESGASFVARVSALDIQHMKEVLKEAIKHKGFSFVEILQPCIAFHDIREDLRKNAYKITSMSKEEAIKEAKNWSYNHKGKIPFGIFYKEERATFEESYEVLKKKMK